MIEYQSPDFPGVRSTMGTSKDGLGRWYSLLSEAQLWGAATTITISGSADYQCQVSQTDCVAAFMGYVLLDARVRAPSKFKHDMTRSLAQA